MAAIAPLISESTLLEEPAAVAVEPALVDPAQLEGEIAAQNLLLVRSREVPESVRYFVEGLADELATLPVGATLRIDPYLLVALQKSLLASLRALESPEPQEARRELRIRLEQLRQVYRDLADARPIYEDRAPKELVRWLVEVLDVPQARIAEALGVSQRTFQRWASEADDSAPAGEDARRVRIVANLVSHLRHALTGAGVIEWLTQPHPLAGGRAPRELLDDADALVTLTSLAASTRSSTAA
jgi:uncharacterized protein (DUF2384 family)